MIKYIPLVNDTRLEDFKDAYFITGYQGFGLVGYLTTRYLVKELRLKKTGFIKTRYMPEVTMYSKDLDILFPFEIYAGTVGSNNVIVVLHNQLPLERERSQYAEYLAKLAKGLAVKEVILVGGVSLELKEDLNEEYRWIPINNTEIVINDAKILEDRVIIGPLALTLMYMKAYDLKGAVLLSFTDPYMPNPKAAAVVVKILSRILGVEIDVLSLIEEAAMIEALEAKRERLEKAIEESEKKTRLTYM